MMSICGVQVCYNLTCKYGYKLTAPSHYPTRQAAAAAGIMLQFVVSVRPANSVIVGNDDFSAGSD